MVDLIAMAERLESAHSRSTLLRSYLKSLKEVGDFYFAFGRFDRSQNQPHEIIHVSYPDDWIEYYTDQKYITEDPTITKVAQTHTPYRWNELRDLLPSQRNIFSGLSTYGVRDGYTIPLHSPDGMVFVASFACRASVTRIDRVILTTLTTQFYFRYQALTLSPSPSVVLSDREKECLRWAARGKSSWETGMIIGISENTVNFHIKNALSKLRCSSRIVGVVRAICLGLIVP
ncbi:LuxR family transcriptional regulator [Gluconacetobacter azotocaptans]|uniref:autoinducer binding domain-containing protein n=1 Tax=Gluconacetobacter azotocaptans TaxID=142834 RepID=UPI001958AF83|nr:autoinducer binding domain-containing protein [Gluconacetobacter azotocaptans]MBM9401915.1 LuxR family transcriptional regulator [Gluconacetobacter azotocaptans]